VGAPAAMLAGAWRFALVSVAAFSVWAFAGGWLTHNVGEGGLYAACALAFVALAGVLLAPLVQGPRRMLRCHLVFVPAFVAHAVAWSACWFLWPSWVGEWSGAALGSALFVTVAAWRFSVWRGAPLAIAVFFAAHALGYFAGGQAMHALAHDGQVRAGMLAWGACYGLGFGAGIGWVFQRLQLPRGDGSPVTGARRPAG
jgi:hypothetical protein